MKEEENNKIEEITDQIENVSITQNKKKKKKKKAKRITNGKAAIGKNGEKKILVSTELIKEGEIVFEDEPYCWIVLSQVKEEYCHSCLKPLNPSKKIKCSKCNYSFFCNQQCKEKGNKFHQIECPILLEIDSISKESEVPVDLMRILLRILIEKKTNQSNFDHILSLDSHQNEYWNNFLNSLEKSHYPFFSSISIFF